MEKPVVGGRRIGGYKNDKKGSPAREASDPYSRQKTVGDYGFGASVCSAEPAF